eukprot:PLAT2488.3.p1 GENE.PLAT2488.3~~PLAT2488.3.p1  ORF type:complete len:628 (+),score=179.51 PLAT2488.3:3-1886(+)
MRMKLKLLLLFLLVLPFVSAGDGGSALQPDEKLPAWMQAMVESETEASPSPAGEAGAIDAETLEGEAIPPAAAAASGESGAASGGEGGAGGEGSAAAPAQQWVSSFFGPDGKDSAHAALAKAEQQPGSEAAASEGSEAGEAAEAPSVGLGFEEQPAGQPADKPAAVPVDAKAAAESEAGAEAAAGKPAADAASEAAAAAPAPAAAAVESESGAGTLAAPPPPAATPAAASTPAASSSAAASASPAAPAAPAAASEAAAAASEAAAVPSAGTVRSQSSAPSFAPLDDFDSQFRSSQSTVPFYRFRLVKNLTHDHLSFTEGFTWDNDHFLESTGLYGQSSVQMVDETGSLLTKTKLADLLFGEGLAYADDELFQLTYMSRMVEVYDRHTLKKTRQQPFPAGAPFEGWGLASNGEEFVMSDGSSRLYVLDRGMATVKRTLVVKDGQFPIDKLNELEYVEGELYANIFGTDCLARISPASGAILGWVNLKGLWSGSDNLRCLNGIAYDSVNKRLFVTGKLWPHIYEIKLERYTPAIANPVQVCGLNTGLFTGLGPNFAGGAGGGGVPMPGGAPAAGGAAVGGMPMAGAAMGAAMAGAPMGGASFDGMPTASEQETADSLQSGVLSAARPLT